MKKKVAFLTTIFPMPEMYLHDFFRSLARQTYKEFDVVLVNDGFIDLDEIKNKYSELNVEELKCSGSASKNRELGINYVRNNDYDILIFGDSDDYFQKNRIEVCIEKLADYDLLVNDLTLFDKSGIISENYISNRVENNSEITLSFVEDKNIFGMTNTAVKVSVLTEVSFVSDLVAVDWYFFSMLLLNGCSALFTAETTTYYRQAQSNTIGLSSSTKETLRKGISVKIKHYELLGCENKRFKELYHDFEAISEKFNDDIYLTKLLSNGISNPLWWEEVRELGK